ncbi:MAG: FAD/NAD(P)-binding protein [Planctomycetaceae bacterium]
MTPPPAGRAALPGSLAADPWRSHAARIVAIRDEAPGVRGYDLELCDSAVREAYRFRPGQFNMLLLPGIGEAAISIASDPDAPHRLTHTVRAVGNVTDALARRCEGDEILLRGPFGTPWPLGALEGGDVIVVAGGLGLASQRAAILTLARQRGAYRRVVVLAGAKAPAGLLYAGEDAAWRAAGIEVERVVESADAGWRGEVGLVTDLVARLGDGRRAGVLCCGPDGMMRAVAGAAAGVGIGPERLWVSMERPMSCAVGQCGLCQFGPFFVCLDGPVFRYDRVARLLEVPGL